MATLSKEAKELFYEMENDLDRYPLPIEFDPREELKALNLRNSKLETIAERFVRLKHFKNDNNTHKAD